VSDFAGKNTSLPSALANRANASRAMVLLCHQPKTEMMEQAHQADIGLVLSGHTHGGQTWPMHAITLAVFKYFAGLYLHQSEADGATGPYVFVSEGVYGWGPRVRFLSLNEINVVVLRSPATFAAENKVADTSATAAVRYAVLSWILLILGAIVLTLTQLSKLCNYFFVIKSQNEDGVGCCCMRAFGSWAKSMQQWERAWILPADATHLDGPVMEQ